MIQSAQIIIQGNQNYLNAIKAVKFMVGKQLFISTSINKPIWDINNRSTRSRIDKLNPVQVRGSLGTPQRFLSISLGDIERSL